MYITSDDSKIEKLYNEKNFHTCCSDDWCFASCLAFHYVEVPLYTSALKMFECRLKAIMMIH